MFHTIYFITHPNVEISSAVPVTQWPLSDTGKVRMRRMLKHSWVNEISAVYCSNERKAADGAEILANHIGLPFESVSQLGENDRSSTGFLEPAEFEATADRFFSAPAVSIRGWETALAAQSRIAEAVSQIDREDPGDGSIAIVSHGAVGTLLYCHLTEKPVDRRWDQPGNSGGNYLKINIGLGVCDWWEAID